MSENDDNFINPSTYPEGGAYGQLLWWHLFVWGTHPKGNTKTSSAEWDLKSFAHAVHEDSGLDIDSPLDNLNNWLYGPHRPRLKERREKIEWLLFEDKLEFQRWKSDLRDSIKRPNIWSVEDFKAEIKKVVGGKVVLKLPFVHHQWHKFKAEPANLNELLRTDLRATSLVGRTEELAMLSAWMSTPQAIAVKCITGGAGAGKTRLAIEACEAAEAAGWFATFLPSGELPSFRDWQAHDNGELPQPTLIVIDYAATSVSAIKPWFNELAPSRHRSGNKLRILLLERHADRESGWWADLLRPSSNAHATSADLIGSENPHALPPLDAVQDRRALLAEVMVKAAPLFDPPCPIISPPWPGEDAWFDERLAANQFDNEPLYLAMAGIRAVECGVAAALSINRLKLAKSVALIEEERLGKFAKAHGFTDGGKLLKHIAACITLQNGCELSTLPSMIRAERQALGMAAVFDDEAVADILCDFLPVAAKAEGIQPDLIGESFCLSVIEGGRSRNDTIRHEIVWRCWQRDAAGTVATLIRSACDLAEESSNHPAVKYLQYIFCENNDLERLEEFENACPIDTLSLGDFSANIAAKAIDLLKSAVNTDAATFTPRLAAALNNFACRLNRLKRHKLALAAAEEAVALYRHLSIDQPDVFTPYLATTLNTLSNSFSNLKLYLPARDAAKDALALYRQLAVVQPEIFDDHLASALNNIALIFVQLGRDEEALTASEDAVAILRKMAIAQPHMFISRLATSLNTLSICLEKLRRFQESLTSQLESAEIYDHLCVKSPDAFKPALAGAMGNVAIRLFNLDRYEDAIFAAEDSVSLYRQLSEKNPEIFSPDFARALSGLGDILECVGRNAEAMANDREAVAALAPFNNNKNHIFQEAISICLREYIQRTERMKLDVDKAIIDLFYPE